MMNISKASDSDLENCVALILTTEMGKRYYPTAQMLRSEMERGLREDELFVLKDDNGTVAGVLWYQLQGIFHSYPYLHIIAVGAEYQGKGLGKKLLAFFENDALEHSSNHLRTRAFLTVGDFNRHAEDVYIRKGYVKVGELEGLFRRNITEKLYMKIVTAAKISS